MDYKNEFYKNRLTEYCNSFKAVASLSMLALAQKNVNVVMSLYKKLNIIFTDIVNLTEIIYDNDIVNCVKTLEVDKLPDFFDVLKTVDSYYKMLSLKYAQTEFETDEENILLNKISIEINHKEEIPFLNIAKIFYNNEKYAEAIEICEYIKTISDSAPVWSILGDIYRATKEYGLSIEAYKKYLELNEDDYEVEKTLQDVYEEALS